jgi:7-carboxy-7-deazaguanine synthase
MTFIRLAGCNAPELGLDCLRWCDTRESWDRNAGVELEISDVILRVRLPRMFITGGEPLLQKEAVALLAAEARGLGMRVHVETNGSLPPPAAVTSTRTAPAAPAGRLFDWVTVSPKPPGYVVAPGWKGLIDELKLVVDDQLTEVIVERLVAEHAGAVVSIQPLWGTEASRAFAGDALEPDRAAMKRAMMMVLDHPEWRLSLQMHKFLGIK